MTAKEKAEELVKKYKGFEMPNEHIASKQCALITVDEILNIYINFPKHPQSIYWQEVKNEIDKL